MHDLILRRCEVEFNAQFPDVAVPVNADSFDCGIARVKHLGWIDVFTHVVVSCGDALCDYSAKRKPPL